MKTWIFLRGLVREKQHWGGFVAQFEQTVPHSRVIALDLPGNGALHTQASPARIPEMVEDCRDQLAAVKLAPPYHLLAMSLGGMVAVAWSSAHPQEIAGQVLINTSMRPLSPFYQRLRPRNYPPLMGLALGSPSPERWERAIWRMTSNQDTAHVLPGWIALRQMHPVTRQNALRQLVAATRFRAPVSRPNVDTLVLTSARDQLVSPECSHALARKWHCDLQVHPTAGHDLPLDDGQWVAQQVKRWLSAASASASP